MAPVEILYLSSRYRNPISLVYDEHEKTLINSINYYVLLSICPLCPLNLSMVTQVIVLTSKKILL